LLLATIAAGLAPGLALLCYFYLKDKYDQEPLSVVAKVFFSGALLVFPIMFIHYVLDTENLIASSIIESFITVGLLEEFFKWFILYNMVYSHLVFDKPYDGIIYSSAVSLGFASAENILYLFANGLELAYSRALLPVSSHAIFGIIMGYYLGKAKFSSSPPLRWILLSLVIPTLLHGGYTYILLTVEDWLLPIVFYMAFLWFLGIRKFRLGTLTEKNHHVY
jgi:protease PrsW